MAMVAGIIHNAGLHLHCTALEGKVWKVWKLWKLWMVLSALGRTVPELE
jgi:hypothetical protein